MKSSKKILFIAFLLAGFFMVTGTSHATTATWTGSGNWNVAGNWTPSGVPASTTDVIFSASSTASTTINAVVDVKSVTITTGYSGTITQSSGNTVTVESGGFSQASGTFIGSSGSDAFTDNGPFSVTGGTFKSTNGRLTLASTTATFSSGFQNNSGTVEFSTSSVITGSSTFYNLQLDAAFGYTNAFTVATGTVLAAQGYLYFQTNYSTIQLLGGGEIDARGNIESSYAPYSATGTVSIVVNGAGAQTIGDPTQSGNGTNIALPNLTLAKSSGALTFQGEIMVSGNWTYNGNGLNAGTSTIVFAAPTATITGSSTFYKLFFINPPVVGSPPSVTSTITISTGTVLTVSSQLGFLGDNTCNPTCGLYGTNIILNGGEIDVQGTDGSPSDPGGGAVSFGNTEGSGSGGTATIVMNGTSTQEISADGDEAVYLPKLTINTPPGVPVWVKWGRNLIITGATAVNSGDFRIASDTAADAGSWGTGSISFVSGVTVSSGAVLSDYSVTPAIVKFGSTVVNNGTVFFDGNGISCTLSLPNYVMLRSIDGVTQGSWSGSGNVIMRYVDAAYQKMTGGTITVYNGTSSGNNTNWSFTTSPEIQLIQTASSSGGSGTSQLTLPAFGFLPRAGDLIVVSVSARRQLIAAPTDSAGNTYILLTSSTFGLAIKNALSLYYAKNILNQTSSLTVTINGTSSFGSPLLSGAAFEYTGVAPSSTVDSYTANTDTSNSATTLTSLSATGLTYNELYFGATTFSASTTASADTGWTARAGVTDNSTLSALYTEEIATTSILTTHASWTAATGTSYAAIMGIFRAPYAFGYAASGTLDSATFDTGVVNGAQLNSVVWQGVQPAGTSVKFQFAVSNASSGPWNFVGSDGTGNTTFPYSGSSNPGATINLYSSSNGYGLFSGYRYFRYRAILYSDITQTYSPTVNQVVVNWSP